jgi:hypothetical protein
MNPLPKAPGLEKSKADLHTASSLIAVAVERAPYDLGVMAALPLRTAASPGLLHG